MKTVTGKVPFLARDSIEHMKTPGRADGGSIMKRTKIRNILLSALLALTVGMPMISFADEGTSAESGASGAGETPYAAGDKDPKADPKLREAAEALSKRAAP